MVEPSLGRPSYVWGFGQERRLSILRRYTTLEGRRLLDVGCGIGTYVRRLMELSHEVYGVDVDEERVRRGSREVPNLALAVAENLPFADNVFDFILLNEVLEHVRDERATLREALRVAKPGGRVAVYTPNRLFPFETHGILLGRRHLFGNVPFVNYLPGPLRRRLAPHVRAYSARDLLALHKGLPARLVAHSYVFPGFDKTAGRSRLLASLLRHLCYALENTPLAIFGLSHLMILEKSDQARADPASAMSSEEGRPERSEGKTGD